MRAISKIGGNTCPIVVTKYTSWSPSLTFFLQKTQQAKRSESLSAQAIPPYSPRFTFTGKERDAETGFSYFGARYYDSDLSSLFLSVDPMSDKYPSISPYAYCAWNPVKLVDPDGMDTTVSINILTGKIDMQGTDESYGNTSVVFISGNNQYSMSVSGSVRLENNSKTKAQCLRFSNKKDGEIVYNTLIGNNENIEASSVEWSLYNMKSGEAELMTSGNYCSISVPDEDRYVGNTEKWQHYQPYNTDVLYYLPSKEDMEHAQNIGANSFLDYCGKQYSITDCIRNGIPKTQRQLEKIVKNNNPSFKDYLLCQ